MLEDKLQVCVLDFPGRLDRYIPLMEFAYNNSYQTSVGMGPYEACMAGNVELLYVG